MRAIYNNKSLRLVAVILLLPACSLLPGKETTTQATNEAIILPVVSAQQPCDCDAQVVKETIKIIEKPCPVLAVSQAVVEDKPVTKETIKTFNNDKSIVGRIERVTLEQSGVVVKARIDTGAKTSSLNALDLTVFERDGKKWVKFAVINPITDENVYFEKKVKRFVRIKQMVTDNQRRPVVMITLRLGGVEEAVEVTLTDRSHYIYQLLVGRNLLLDRMLVDVSQKYIASDTGS
jgi:hypothetical protein